MFRHVIPIGRIFGISIDLDYSWFLIVGLLAWILAVSYYPVAFPGAGRLEYWAMGALTAVMLFVSVLIHELGHSVVAQRYGLSVPRITLFLFGGVSQIAAEPPNAAAEFWIAIVGPLVSFALAALFWELEPLFTGSPPWFAVVKYLALLNLVLGIFNLIPGFPLDGGRVLRAIIWRITHAYKRATVAAAVTGRFFGFALIFLGVWEVLTGALLSGLWIGFIGWYLESAAGSQLQWELMRSLVGDHKVLDAMSRDFPLVSGDTSLQELVEQFILPKGNRYFVVSGPSGPLGFITLASAHNVSRAAWPATTASQVMIPFEKLDTVRPETPLWDALEKMGRDGVNQMPVMDGNGIVGVLSRDDILHYLRVIKALAS
ncbi:MAG TPA: site-2 protease family protein [Acidobacteriaceae bacterium]|nr:site-2 protease family protein [Acidobacteriaceae bacterium]